MEGSPQMSRAAGEALSPCLPSPSSSSSSACTYTEDACGRWNSAYGIFEAKETCDEGDEDEEEEELSIPGLLRRQTQFQPGEDYGTKLQCKPDLCHMRALAIRWMVKAHSLFNFSPVSVALAVNYMDRYLDKSLAPAWKPWMMELLSVTCLSLAAKIEEVEVPALLDLQACEGLDHTFEAKTVQRMEMNVLGALNWRLNSITAFSFVEKAINGFHLRPHLKKALMTRTSELLLSAFQERELLEFEPSLLGVSSMCFALEEILPVQAEQLKLSTFKYIPLKAEKVRCCYVQMESLIVDPICATMTMTESGSTKSPLSPNTVAYHIKINASEGTSTFVGSANLFSRQIDIEEIVLCPKRQRRC
ncbi:hypothetical protein GOP47_0007034 [Adiantum capillus-veneris]|uniref:Cyclin-like domain-containing protein n=1 Tax=Adiantum capillus-veneris TaxID=13818 RepID=A0A9D4V0J8_ADICA|nr:hypothetical protein GOP47_0007034 [Adiantum capillus-veneris]